MAANSSAYWLEAAFSTYPDGSPSSWPQSRRENSRASSNRLARRSATNAAVASAPNRSGKMPCRWSV